MKSLIAALTLFTAVFAPPQLAAKAPTVRITITVPDGASPVEINDSAVTQFYIWEGPGVYINRVAQTVGFIADWANGPAAMPPVSLQRYQVAFYTGCAEPPAVGCNVSEPQLSYVVFYTYDKAKRAGYVHLPGRGEQWFDTNARSIFRGVEGKWFPASADWQTFAAQHLVKLHQ